MINSLADAVGYCQQVGLASVRVVGDFFHMNIEEPDLAASLREAAPYIAHMQLGDSGRLEPGTGHVDFAAGIAALREAGYDGWYAMECGLSGDPIQVLPSVPKYLRGSASAPDRPLRRDAGMVSTVIEWAGNVQDAPSRNFSIEPAVALTLPGSSKELAAVISGPFTSSTVAVCGCSGVRQPDLGGYVPHRVPVDHAQHQGPAFRRIGGYRIQHRERPRSAIRWIQGFGSASSTTSCRSQSTNTSTEVSPR